MKTTSKILFGLIALFLVGVWSASAQEFSTVRCRVEAVDATNQTLTVRHLDDDKVIILHFTAESVVFRNGNPATVSDLQEGDMAGGLLFAKSQDYIKVKRLYLRQSDHL